MTWDVNVSSLPIWLPDLMKLSHRILVYDLSNDKLRFDIGVVR